MKFYIAMWPLQDPFIRGQLLLNNDWTVGLIWMTGCRKSMAPCCSGGGQKLRVSESGVQPLPACLPPISTS